MKKEIKIPFTKNGEFQAYPDYRTADWRANAAFKSTLTCIGYGRGRSSAVFIWRDIHWKEYSMFISNMSEVISNNELAYGKLDGYWNFVKKGTNYSLNFLGPNYVEDETA